MTNIQTYDYAFIGLGAANSLLIKNLHQNNLLKGKSILIFEPDEKNWNDKSFCYWANPKENNTLGISDLSKVCWNEIKVNQAPSEKLNNLKYFYINSLDLYNQTKSILSYYSVKLVAKVVNHLDTTKDGEIVIKNGVDNYYPKFVFDSRPPKWHDLKSNESFLWQSFIGWRIELDSELEYSEPNTFTMMDFGVEQNNSCQFMYTLPFSQNEILIELTRFDKEILTQNTAEPILSRYIQNYLGFNNYKVKEIEIGKIPMSSGKIKKEVVHHNHILMGSAAGLVKPSTGYAFKRMAYHSLSIAEGIKVNDQPTVPSNKPNRFKFYDRLLLKILEKEPNKGAHIFSSLFKKVPTPLVLKFLDERTNLNQDFKILGSLPKGIFIKTAILDIKSKINVLFKLLTPILITLIAVFIYKMGFRGIIQYGLLTGLILVGIPHGAMDHLLLTRKIEAPVTPYFIINYLLIGAGMYAVWWLSPLVGLIIFITYSAWHFGQTDCEEWKISRNVTVQFLIGIWVLTTLFSFHLNEFNSIINSIGVTSVLIPHGFLGLNLFLEICILFSAVLLLITRNTYIIEILLILTIGSQLPLLYSFGIYFILVHSLNGWKHLKQKLNTSNLILAKKATPFSLGAFLIFIFFFSNIFGYWQENIGPFFIFLSCLSFPHVIKMTKFYKRQSLNKF